MEENKTFVEKMPSFANKTTQTDDMNSISDSFNELRIKRSYYSPGRKIIKPPPGKWWWKPPDDPHYIAAGGIIICDRQKDGEVEKDGIWVLIEKSRRGSGLEYTDIGGKYDWNDGDIYATISREFREELYNTDEISYRTIKHLCGQSKSDDSDNELFIMRKGKYMCLIVDRKLLPDVSLDYRKVEEARKKILSENPFCRNEMYRTVSLQFLPFDRIAEEKDKLSYRLSTILKESELRNKIPNIQSLNVPRSTSTSHINIKSISTPNIRLEPSYMSTKEYPTRLHYLPPGYKKPQNQNF